MLDTELNTHLKTDDGGRFIEQPIQNPLVPAHPHGPVLTFSKTLILFHTHQKKKMKSVKLVTRRGILIDDVVVVSEQFSDLLIKSFVNGSQDIESGA